MPNALPTLFDAVYWCVWFSVYTSAGAAALWIVDLSWGPSLAQRAFSLALGYVTFLHAFVLSLGLLKRLVQPRLTPGSTTVGANREFMAWGLNSVFQGVFTASFCADQIHLLFWLRYLYYRLMGMKLSPGSIIGTGCSLRQVELITLGPGATVGLNVTMSCHFSPDGKKHVQEPIAIGARTLIGADCRIGPGTVVGSNTVIGMNTTLLGARVGDNVRIGAGAFLGRGVEVPDGARIPNGAVIYQDSPTRAPSARAAAETSAPALREPA